MLNTILLRSKDQKSVVKIDNGELISFKKCGVEYIHQKRNKGWDNSDTEMFPVIGPTIKNQHKVTTKKGIAILDQHGLLRELTYQQTRCSNFEVVYTKEYFKNSPLKNRKYPNKSEKENVFWPYDFSFKKSFLLTDSFLEISFEVFAEKGMPFMFGYHPAFELSGDKNEFCRTKKETISLNQIFKVGGDAYPVLNCNEIILENSIKNNIKISTTGFHNFMLWTEVNSMLCIEPITHFPNLITQQYSEKNMLLSSGSDIFTVKIEVLE